MLYVIDVICLVVFFVNRIIIRKKIITNHWLIDESLIIVANNKCMKSLQRSREFSRCALDLNLLLFATNNWYWLLEKKTGLNYHKQGAKTKRTYLSVQWGGASRFACAILTCEGGGSSSCGARGSRRRSHACRSACAGVSRFSGSHSRHLKIKARG